MASSYDKADFGWLKTDFARSKFVEALQNYQQVERDYRARYKQRVERQFRIGMF